jgi:hypothetical protein
VISTTEEVVRMCCLTIGFVVAVWGTVKVFDILVNNSINKNENR